MDRMDEKIMALMNEMEENKDDPVWRSSQGSVEIDLQKPIIHIDGEPISFVERTILDGQASLVIPKMFVQMSPEMAALKYPSERRPSLIYTNNSGTINFSFNHTNTPLDDQSMKQFHEVVVKMIRKTQPILQWYEDGVVEQENRTIGYCEFMTPVMNANLYNYILMLVLNERALLCSFNCTEGEAAGWKPVAKAILNSLVIHQDKEGGAL